MEVDRSPVVALVLAGGGPEDRLARAAGVRAKALVPVGGEPLAGFTLRALAGSRRVERVVYVGELPPGLAAGVDAHLPGGARLVDSLALGMGAALATLPGAPVLLVTADLPWLEAGALDRFVAAAVGADLAYPIVEESVARAAFPGQRRTWVRLRQGRFTGGNAMLVSPAIVPNLLVFVDRVYSARKNPLRLSGLLGLSTIAAVVSGRADLSQLEERVAALLGARAVRAVVSPDAGLAADVDRPEQLEAVLN